MNNKQENNKTWLNRNVLGFGLTSFFGDASHEMTTVVLPAFITTLVGGALAPQILGIVSGFADAAASFVRIFAGWISDKMEHRKRLVVAGYAATGIFAGLTGFASNWWQALLYRTLAWTGRGLREPPRDAMLADSVSQPYYGRAFGFHRAMDTFGAIAGPLFVYFALTSAGLKNIFIFAFIPGILSVVAVTLLTKEKLNRGTSKQSFNFWKDVASLPKSFRVFLLVMFVFGIGNFSRTLILLRTQEILTPMNGLILAGSFTILLYSFRNVIQAAADYLIGRLSDIIGRKIPLAFFGFFFFGILSIGLAYPIPNSWFFIALFALSGVSAAAYTALEKAYAADLLPIHLRGTGYGVLQTVDGIGDFASSFMVGFLWSAISPSAGFFYAAILSFSAILLLYFSRRQN